MKTLRKILAVLLILNLLGACSSEKKTDLTGDWQLLRIDSETDPLSEEDMKQLRDLGLNIVLTLREDGTGTYDIMGGISEVTYDAKEMKLTLEGYPVDMRIEKGLLILSESGSQSELVFERIPEE